jgi:hypothetical protein
MFYSVPEVQTEHFHLTLNMCFGIMNAHLLLYVQLESIFLVFSVLSLGYLEYVPDMKLLSASQSLAKKKTLDSILCCQHKLFLYSS